MGYLPTGTPQRLSRLGLGYLANPSFLCDDPVGLLTLFDNLRTPEFYSEEIYRVLGDAPFTFSNTPVIAGKSVPLRVCPQGK